MIVEKACPVCGKTFNCHHDDDITKCQCATVKLNKPAYEYISQNYSNCLCADCLRKIVTKHS